MTIGEHFRWIWEKNPRQQGWYLISYCWDFREGEFYAVDFFRLFEGWDEYYDYPIRGHLGPFQSEGAARAELDKIEVDL